MATPLEALQNRANSLSSSLNSSDTAYLPNTTPSSTDLSESAQLNAENKKIETLRSTQLKNEWYGTAPEPTGDSSTSDGWVIGGLKALQKPLNAIVGAGQYMLGKGTQPDLESNINNAMKTGLTSGNVLNQYGAPRAVQVPLGFALDVMLDPVNWLTMGADTLVGGATEGAVKGFSEAGTESGIKGALEGAGTSIASNLTRKASKVMDLMPFARQVGNAIPAVAEDGASLGIGDTIKNAAISGASSYNDIATKIAAKSLALSDTYDAITGTSIADKLGKGVLGMQSGYLGNSLENIVRGRTPVPGLGFLGDEVAPGITRGDKIADFFKYSPKTASEEALLKDQVGQLAKDKGVLLVGGSKGWNFENIDDAMKPGATVDLKQTMNDSVDGIVSDADSSLNKPLTVQIRDANGVLDPAYARQSTAADTFDNAQKLLDNAVQEGIIQEYNMKNLVHAYTTTAKGTSGVKFYDDWIQSLKDMKVGDVIQKFGGDAPASEDVYNEANELVKTVNSYGGVKDWQPINKVLSAYQNDFIPIFKSAKTAMNPATHLVVGLGHFFMGVMQGLPMFDPDWISSIARARSMYAGNLGPAEFKEMFMNDGMSLMQMAIDNPNSFRQLSNLSASALGDKISAEQMINYLSSSKNGPEVARILREAVSNIDTGMEQVSPEDWGDVMTKASDIASKSKGREAEFKDAMGSMETPYENVAKRIKDAPIARSEEFSNDTNLLSADNPNKLLEKIQANTKTWAQQNPGNFAYKAADFLANGMPQSFNEIPSSLKLGTTDALTRIGLTKAQLIQVSRSVPIDFEKDIVATYAKGAETMYRLTPLKAGQVALETFMNYAAMPDFVRMMRAIPIVGVPFASFPYAMAVKTVKTAINNPAIFNKVAFMINEMNADRSPSEKQALASKYNDYLNSPSVVKMFGIWNTDVSKMIPYYNMNIFNPSEKNYGTSTQDGMLKLVDKFPLLQDPVGSMIKDYFIQPWVLNGSGEQAQGEFGEPLMPSYDANGKPITPSFRTQAFYGARALGESLVPGIAAYAGILNAPGELSASAVNMVPSYGFRNLANAAAGIGDPSLNGMGRSSIGAATKEDAIRKTFRSLLGRSGIPAYLLNDTATSSTVQ